MLANTGGGADRCGRAVIVGMTEVESGLESALRADAFLRTEVAGYSKTAVLTAWSPERHAHHDTTKGLAEFVAGHNIEQVFITLPMTSTAGSCRCWSNFTNSTRFHLLRPGPDCVQSHPGRFDVLGGSRSWPSVKHPSTGRLGPQAISLTS